MWFQYDDDRREPHTNTYNVLVRIRRNLFYRFFGLGPNSTEAAESSYTRVSAIIAARVGRNLSRNFNVGAFFEARGDKPEVHAIKGLPETQELFPDAPGLNGAAFLRQGLSARYDTREEGDYALTGFASEIDGSIAEGVAGGVGVFGQLIWNTRVVKQELDWLQGGGRLYWRQLIGNNANIPFYDQASLGGELLLRGFQEDRFIDMGAWELEFEQRIRLFETHLFGVVSDWRLDPFVAAGQVYGPDAGPFSHVRYSAGLGLRAWIKPDILGRVDLAWGGEGIRAYVVLGYPY
jgi:outer membrane protein assembly factor BamA